MEFPEGFGITGLISENTDSLALISAPEGMKAAGVFTTNKLKAHPVVYSKKILSKSLHKAVVISRGGANAATGRAGREKLQQFIQEISKKTSFEPDSILAASTGIIGTLPRWDPHELDELCLNRDKIRPMDFARAIMTTDTREKTVFSSCRLNGKKVRIFGTAKGSGMICPSLATMLSFIMTDADISKKMLSKALKAAAAESFNCLIVDGETSTNDSVYLLASGKASNREIKKESRSYEKFYQCLLNVCTSLSEMLAEDGEGATKTVKIKVTGASSESAAETAGRAIACSPLCKTAFYGASPNWGRIASAIGAAGIKIDQDSFSLYANGVSWVKNGIPAKSSLGRLKEVLQGSRYELEVVLGRGPGKYQAYTCDYSPEYVRINAHYLS